MWFFKHCKCNKQALILEGTLTYIKFSIGLQTTVLPLLCLTTIQEKMEVDEETKQRFEADITSPTKTAASPQTSTNQDKSPSKTPSRTPRRVPLITLSSPKGKKNQAGDQR